METYESIKEKVRQERSQTPGNIVDSSYINSFFTDAKNFVDTQNTTLEKADWASSTNADAYKSRGESLFDLTSRADRIRKYLDDNKSGMKAEDYDRLRSSLDQYNQAFSSVRGISENNKAFYSQFDSQEQYDKYIEDQKNKTQKDKWGITRHYEDGPMTYPISPSEEEDTGLFKAGAFDDGYQFGDVTKTVIGTAGDLLGNAAKGFWRMFEGLGDTILYGASGLADLVGADDVASYLKNEANHETVEKGFAPFLNDVNKYSVLGGTMDSVAQGVGNSAALMLPSGVTQGLGLGAKAASLATTGTTFASGLGSGMSEAYNSGKDVSGLEAFSYGVLKGAVEAGTEALFGGAGKAVNALGISHGIGGIDDMIVTKLTEKLTNQTVKSLIGLGVKSVGEGVEEVLAGLGTAVSKWLTYMSEEDLGKLIEDENLMESFVVGFLSSAISQSPDVVGSIKSGNEKAVLKYLEGLYQGEELKRQQQAIRDNSVLAGIATPTVTATPSQQTDALANVEDLLRAAKPDPVADATKAFKESGIVSNSKAEAILASPEALQQLTEQTGIPIEGTKSQQRAAVKEAVAKLNEQNAEGGSVPVAEESAVTEESSAAPVVSKVETTAEELFPDDLSPIQTELDRLLQKKESLENRMMDVLQKEDLDSFYQINSEYEPVVARIKELEAEVAESDSGRINSLDDADAPPKKTAPYYEADSVTVDDPFENRDMREVGNRKVKAYMYENPEVKPFFQEAATYMLGDLENGTRGEKWFNDDVYYQSGGEKGWGGTKRRTTDDIAELLDQWHYTYAEIEKGLNAIIEDNGAENNAVSKRIEFMLNDRLMNGYTDVWGEYIPANQDYINLINEKQITEYNKEAFDSFMATADQYFAEATYPNESVGAAPAGFGAETYEEAQSKVISNSYANATDESMRQSGEEALKNDPDIGTYYRSKEATSVRNAESRTQTKEQVEYEYRYLMENGINSAEDLDTSMRVREALFEAGDKRFQDMVRLQRQTGTKSGQITQAFAKYSRMSADSVAAEVVDSLDQLTQDNVPKKFWKKIGFDQFKEKTLSSAMDIAKQIGAVENGDVAGMKDIIRSLAKFRKTTAWFGRSSNLTKTAEAAMNSLTFDEAKAIANAQLSTLPNDFKKRPIGQVVKTFRIHNMLSALTTINRNLTGNATIGFVDAVSDSTVGRFFDNLVSKATGKRTVGNDVKYAKTYFTKAWDATKMAALCAELDIPMEDETKYSAGRTRVYSPQGNPVMRFFSAYEKYMKYALEVTDQFFSGGTNATVDESLANLGENANLSEDERKAVSELAGQRRTFKDERTATRLAKGLRKGLNHIGTENIGLGDITMPFASIGSTMAHTATDYTAGAITGTVEILKLISDVKHGKYVDVDGVKTKTVRGKNGETRQITLAEAQRAAVTNAARGVTGIPLIATFAGLALAGVLKVHDDDDPEKRALDQSQGLSGAQLNIDAALRWLTGGSSEWRDGDAVISLDFLEPFNAQMYLGWLVAQDDSVAEAIKNYPKNAMVSVVKSIADMPAMQGMQEAMDLLNGLTSLDEDTDFGDWATDAAGTFLGSTATSFIPSWIRQTAQVIDPYYHDTTGENALDSAWNQFAAAVPFLSQTLPKKYSGLGQEQRRYDDLASGIFNTFFNPGDADRLNLSDVASYLDALSERTGDESMYPSYRAPGSVGSGDDKIVISGKDMTEAYQKTYGENVNRIYEDLIASSDFEAMDDASKIKALNDAKTYASATAKKEVGANASIPKYISERPTGMSEAEAIVLHSVKSYIDQAIGSLVDNFNVDVDPGAVDAKLDEAYTVFGNMSDAVKNAMLEEGGRVKYFLSAKSAGVSTRAFGDIYQRFYGISNETSKASVKAQQFASYLEKLEADGVITQEQKSVIKNTMKFYNMSPADTVVYDRFVESGVESENADYIIELFGGLTPEEGYTSVRPVQKYEAIAGAEGFTEEEKIAAMKAQITDEKLEAKFDMAIDHGYDTEDFADAYRANSENKKKADFIKSMKDMGYSAADAIWFYNLYHGK